MASINNSNQKKSIRRETPSVSTKAISTFLTSRVINSNSQKVVRIPVKNPGNAKQELSASQQHSGSSSSLLFPGSRRLKYTYTDSVYDPARQKTQKGSSIFQKLNQIQLKKNETLKRPNHLNGGQKKMTYFGKESKKTFHHSSFFNTQNQNYGQLRFLKKNGSLFIRK